MNFDSTFFGAEGPNDADRSYAGSRYADVREAIFRNPYYLSWGSPSETPLPVYGVTFGRLLRGILPCARSWLFHQAVRRAVTSQADLRWGPDQLGYRRLLHPNGVCLTGKWIIDDSPEGERYSGYFQKGSEALIVARYSTCCTETRRGRYRSLALVGKLFPTTEPGHTEPLRTANFITQEDLGGAKSVYLSDAVLRNAPDTSPWRRGFGLPILLATALTFKLTDNQVSNRQLYEVAELGKPSDEPTRSPEFMQLTLSPGQQQIRGDDLDFRDEVLGQIYDKGDPAPKRTLSFDINVSDRGKTRGLLVQRRTIGPWKKIGRIEFSEAVASYNGDFVIHFRHPPWRNNRNDPASVARVR